MHWNANGLLSKQSEFKQHIANNQETFLKEDKQIYVPGYDIIRSDRIEAKGGLMMLIKHDVKYITLPSPPNVECQIVEISTKLGKTTLVNTYVAPTKEIDVPSYQSLFSRPNTIIVGDFNAKNRLWNSPSDNTRGRAVEQLIDQNNFVVLNDGKPTFQNTQGHLSYIDLTIVSSNLATKCTWYTLNNMMGADHTPIVCRVEDILQTESATVTKWKLSKADWQQYRGQCRDHILNTDLYDDDIEKFSDNVMNMINTAANISVPKRKAGQRGKRKPLPYWNDKVKSAVYERNRARNKMNRANTQQKRGRL